jgi:hypothetical protein
MYVLIVIPLVEIPHGNGPGIGARFHGDPKARFVLHLHEDHTRGKLLQGPEPEAAQLM